jgi:hypothetical protein
VSQAATTTFGTVKTELYNSGFNYLLDNSQTDRAGRWVNQSYQEVCSLAAWPFLKTTTTGASPVSIPTLNRIIYVRDQSTNFKLVEADFDLLTDLQPNLTTTGTAGWYYLDFTSGAPAVTAFPVTTNTLQIVYLQNPTPLASDSDVLIVPDQFVDVVVLGAMRRAYLDGTDNAQQYQMVKSEYNDRVEYMRTQLLPRPSYQEISIWPSASTDW